MFNNRKKLYTICSRCAVYQNDTNISHQQFYLAEVKSKVVQEIYALLILTDLKMITKFQLVFLGLM